MWGVSNERHIVRLLFTQSKTTKNTAFTLSKTSKQKPAGGIKICKGYIHTTTAVCGLNMTFMWHKCVGRKQKHYKYCTKSDIYNCNLNHFHMWKYIL